MAPSFCTEDDLLGAVSGAARGCGLFTEDYLLGAVSGAAGSCGRKTGSIRELSLLRAVLFQSRGRRNHFGMRAYTAREIRTIPVPTQSQPRCQESAQPPSSFSCS